MANRLTVKDCALVCQNLEVCGNLTVQGTHTTLNTTVTATTTAVTDNFVLESSDAGSSTGPDFRLFRSSASPAASDNIGQIMFDGRDSAGNVQNYGAIFTKLADPTSGSEDSTLFLNTYLGGAEKNVVIAGGNLGIGTTSTSHPLTVKSTAGDKGISLLDSSNREILQVRFEGGNSSAILLCNHGTSSVTTLITGRTNNNNYFNTGGNLGIGRTDPSSKIDVVGQCASGCTFKFADTSGRTLQDLGGGILSWNAASVFGSGTWAGTGDFEIVSGTTGRHALQVNGPAGAKHTLWATGGTTAGTPTAWIHNSNNVAGADTLVVSSVSENDSEPFAIRTNTTTFGGGDTDFIVRLVSNAPRVGIGTATPNCILDMYVNSTTNICFGNQTTFRNNTSGCGVRIYNSDAAGWSLKVGDGDNLVVKGSSSGNVGIGYATPEYNLTVKDCIGMKNSAGHRRPILKLTTMGYSTGYQAAIIGSACTCYSCQTTGAVMLSFNYDPNTNSSGSFAGGGSEVIWRRPTTFLTPNAANNGFQVTARLCDTSMEACCFKSTVMSCAPIHCATSCFTLTNTYLHNTCIYVAGNATIAGTIYTGGLLCGCITAASCCVSSPVVCGTSCVRAGCRMQISGAGAQGMYIGSTNSEASIYLDGSNGDWSGSDYAWIRHDNAKNLVIGNDSGGLGFNLMNHSANCMQFGTSNAYRLVIEAGGNIRVCLGLHACTCVHSPKVCGTTHVHSALICGSSWVCSGGTICGVTLCAGVVCGTTCVKTGNLCLNASGGSTLECALVFDATANGNMSSTFRMGTSWDGTVNTVFLGDSNSRTLNISDQDRVGIGHQSPRGLLHLRHTNNDCVPSFITSHAGATTGSYSTEPMWSRKWLLHVTTAGDVTQNDANSKIIRLQLPASYADANGSSGTIKITYLQGHSAGTMSFEYKFGQYYGGAQTTTYTTWDFGDFKVQKIGQLHKEYNYLNTAKAAYIRDNIKFYRHDPADGTFDVRSSGLVIKLPNSGTSRVVDISVEIEATGRSGNEDKIKLQDLGTWTANAPSGLTLLTPTVFWLGDNTDTTICTSSVVCSNCCIRSPIVCATGSVKTPHICQDNVNPYLCIQGGCHDAGVGGLKIMNCNGSTKGYVYWGGVNSFGLLHCDAGWAVKLNGNASICLGRCTWVDTCVCSPVVCGCTCVKAEILRVNSCVLLGGGGSRIWANNRRQLEGATDGSVTQIGEDFTCQRLHGCTFACGRLESPIVCGTSCVRSGLIYGNSNICSAGVLYGAGLWCMPVGGGANRLLIGTKRALEGTTDGATLGLGEDYTCVWSRAGCFEAAGCVISPIICGTTCVKTGNVSASGWAYAGSYVQSPIHYPTGYGNKVCLMAGNAAENAWCIALTTQKGDPPSVYVCGHLNTYGVVDVTPSNSGKLRANTCVQISGGGGWLSGCSGHSLWVCANQNQPASFQSPNANTWVDIKSTCSTWSMGAMGSGQFGLYNRHGSACTQFFADTAGAVCARTCFCAPTICSSSVLCANNGAATLLVSHAAGSKILYSSVGFTTATGSTTLSHGSNILFQVGGTTTLCVTADTYVKGNLEPMVNNTKCLGSGSKFWLCGYIYNLTGSTVKASSASWVAICASAGGVSAATCVTAPIVCGTSCLRSNVLHAPGDLCIYADGQHTMSFWRSGSDDWAEICCYLRVKSSAFACTCVRSPHICGTTAVCSPIVCATSKVRTSRINDNCWIGCNSVAITCSTWVTGATVCLNNHEGGYLKIVIAGDWNGHSSVGYMAEYFIQDGANGYSQPGTVIREVTNQHNSDYITSRICDPGSASTPRQYKIQFQTVVPGSNTTANVYAYYDFTGRAQGVS